MARLEPDGEEEGTVAKLETADKAKALISALNLVSRNLPLPPGLFNSVSSIYRNDAAEEENDNTQEEEGGKLGGYGDLLSEFDEAMSMQREKFALSSVLADSWKSRFQGHISRRMKEIEEMPCTRGEDVQTKCLLEFYGLKLRDLQSKVRSDVSSEYWLWMHCASPDKQLFDWGQACAPQPMYGLGDVFAMEADDQFRKTRDAERLSRLEEEEKNHVETKKRMFVAEIMNAIREYTLQLGASQKRRKQRNDFVLACCCIFLSQWHGKQKQRATRAEKLRFQALKSGDQKAYMKMVKESKNERLTTLLQETNKLLVSLGAAVQRQKDAKFPDGIESLEDSGDYSPGLEASKDGSPGDTPEEEEDLIDSDRNDEGGDLLEGQRQYNSAIHSIQEMVTEQPSLLKGGQLRPYQIEGLQWMLSLFNNNLNGILADEMGLGKTIQTISLIVYLKEKKGVPGPHLIVAPKAVLPNWINEFSTWVPEDEIKAVLYDGRADERKSIKEQLLKEGKFNVLITHYDLIMRDKAFLKKIQWNYMIVDEGHRLKNHECALSRTLDSGYQIQRRLLLTGTPIQNNLQELWSLLNFLLPNIFNSVQNFEDWFNAPFADRDDVTLTEEEQLLVIRRLHHVIRPFILRRKKDEVEKYLPSKSQVILKCDLSAWQEVYYQQVTEMGRVGLQTGSGKSKSLQNLTMQLRKCCNHPYLFVGDYNMWRKDEIMRAAGKFELLDRLLPKLRATDHRVLLFSQMTRLMDILEIYLQLNGYKFLRLDGSTKTEERGSLLKQFNAPNSPYFMFLLSTRAGGLGLNLQTADTVIIFDSDWNPQMDQQAEDRAHRIGQKKEVRVFVLVSVGSVEEEILARAKQKKGIDAKVIQAGLFNTTATAQDRREMLEEIMRKGTSTLGRDVPTEREINRLAARSQEEFRIFEEMDKERRQKENYRSRLMEDHEVPEWAYSTPETKEDKSKAFNKKNLALLGKRRRKEVTYADSMSDLQWMKAAEKGQDVSKLSAREKRRERAPSETNEPFSNTAGARNNVPEPRNENMPAASEATSGDTYGSDVKIKYDGGVSETVEYQGSAEPWNEDVDVGGTSWNNKVFTWKTHKRKRSNYVVQTSSDSRGNNGSNGRGNGWGLT